MRPRRPQRGLVGCSPANTMPELRAGGPQPRHRHLHVQGLLEDRPSPVTISSASAGHRQMRVLCDCRTVPAANASSPARPPAAPRPAALTARRRVNSIAHAARRPSNTATVTCPRPSAARTPNTPWSQQWAFRHPGGDHLDVGQRNRRAASRPPPSVIILPVGIRL